MKHFFYIVLPIVLTSVLVTGCKTQKTVAAFSDLNGEWTIKEMNGRALDPEKTSQFMLLDMERQTLSGSAGCNRMSGKIDYSPDRKNIVKFPGIATTRMACQDMLLESEFLKVLGEVVRFEAVTDKKPVDTIAFYGIDNTKLLVIERKRGLE